MENIFIFGYLDNLMPSAMCNMSSLPSVLPIEKRTPLFSSSQTKLLNEEVSSAGMYRAVYPCKSNSSAYS